MALEDLYHMIEHPQVHGELRGNFLHEIGLLLR